MLRLPDLTGSQFVRDRRGWRVVAADGTPLTRSWPTRTQAMTALTLPDEGPRRAGLALLFLIVSAGVAGLGMLAIALAKGAL